MKIAVYPGSFDPITLGHYDLIERASKIFDKVVVLIGKNSSKSPLFSVEERMSMIEMTVKDLPNVSVDSNDNLTVEYAREIGASALLRGVRAFSDFEYELQMALMNRRLDSKIETVFLMPKNELSFINSSLLKGVAQFGGSISDFVPKGIEQIVKKKFEVLK
ncbi:MAG: pantetheine-phosphate adenylyltransferase [Candidatus Cloacimonadota bacterium]|nr:MAG: pantetheine-phosphate adenylyltransferase [Candidatus Cloacimonadota bacterium]PIE77596.1 MAG: pantetheine-phosphate adenylyltransferase [Candidatus Delongbacteria bacterium]